MKHKRFLSMLVLLAAVVTGAYATEFTSLKVGDVLHVGDVINTSTTYRVCGMYLQANFQPATLVRADISGNNITESETGAYYILKDKDGYYYGHIVGGEGGYWPVTDTSDGISVTTIVPDNYTELIFAVHEGPAPAGYTVTLAEGTEDADKWTISPAKGLKGGETVTATYSGEKKVKSVKAVKEGGAEPVDNTYMKWDADQKKLVATDIPAEVTSVEDADENIEWAGTYVVEGDVTINGQIKLNGNVDLIIKDGAKLTVTNLIVGYDKNLSIYGQANQTGQLVANYSENAITNINTLEVHSCQVKATSSANSYSGFNNIQTFNVYGGSVDAESTAASRGYGISMYSSGSMYIYGGDVKALGKGNKYGIRGSDSTITVYGGKLWAGCANGKAIYASYVTLTKGAGFTGKIETSDNGESWSEYTEAVTPETRYVRAGY